MCSFSSLLPPPSVPLTPSMGRSSKHQFVSTLSTVRTISIYPTIVEQTTSILPKTPKTPLRKLAGSLSSTSQSSFSSDISAPSPSPSPASSSSSKEESTLKKLDTGYLSLSELDSESQKCFKLAKKYFNNNKFRLIDQNKFTQALELLDVVLNEYPTFLPALELRLCIHQDKLQANMEALFDTNRILAINPGHLEALRRRITIFYDLKLYSKVRELAGRILYICPTDEVALQCMRDIRNKKVEKLKTQLQMLFQTKHYEKATEVAESILKIQESDCDAINYLQAIRLKKIEALKYRMKTLFYSKDYDNAKKIADQLLTLDPEDVYAQKYKGAILVQKDENAEGFHILKDANQYCPGDRLILLHLSIALYRLNGYLPALTCLDSILKNDSYDTEALLLRANVHLILNNTALAQEDLSKIDVRDRNEEYTRLLKIVEQNQSPKIGCGALMLPTPARSPRISVTV